MIERTITVQITIEVQAHEDVSGLTPKELAQLVYELVEDERKELAIAMRLAAWNLLAGDPPDEEL